VDPQEFERHFSGIVVSDGSSPDLGDLSYLRKDKYEADMAAQIAAASRIELSALSSASAPAVKILYSRENFPSISRTENCAAALTAAEAIGLRPSPRTFHKHVIRVVQGLKTIFLIDQRLSPYAGSDAVKPPPSMRALASGEGQSCIAACSSKGLRCDASLFDFVNDCKSLHSLFACEKGCDYNVGPDIPNYVSSARNGKHFGKCLVTDTFPTCDATHWSTNRICPCA
jgi:hypothetical protein